MTTSKTIDLSQKDQSTLRKLSSTADILCGYLELLREKMASDEDADENIEAHIISCLELSTQLMEHAGLARVLGGSND